MPQHEKVKVKMLVTQLCLTLCDPMDCNLPGSSVPQDSPGKNTGVGCHSFLQGSSQLRDQTHISCIGRWILHRLSQKMLDMLSGFLNLLSLVLHWASLICVFRIFVKFGEKISHYFFKYFLCTHFSLSFYNLAVLGL